jgi:hypothetical protein
MKRAESETAAPCVTTQAASDSENRCRESTERRAGILRGKVIPFPRRNPEPQDRRVKALAVRAQYHAIVAELIEMEIWCRAAGYIDEAGNIAPIVEEAATSLRYFEPKVLAEVSE